MKKQTLIFAIIASLMILPILGCGSQPEAGQEIPAAEVAQNQANDTVVFDDVVTESVSETAVETEVKEVAIVEAEESPSVEESPSNAQDAQEVEGFHEPHMADDTHEKNITDGTYESHHGANNVDDTETNLGTIVSEDADASEMTAVPFTATTGLDTFSAYRMNFLVDFDGSRKGQTTQGTMSGLLEITRKPQAKHWQMNMSGDTFGELSALGSIELYDFGKIMYIQNPLDATWLGVPAEMVKTMLPVPIDDMYRPEKSIDLPATAVLQPGEEVVNGVVTQRYTFGLDDLADSGTQYEAVKGTVWVAVDGDYVVKYESTITGEFDNLSAGSMDLMDQGTIVMSYEVSDVNGDFSIQPPTDAQGLDLGKLLSGLNF